MKDLIDDNNCVLKFVMMLESSHHYSALQSHFDYFFILNINARHYLAKIKSEILSILSPTPTQQARIDLQF